MLYLTLARVGGGKTTHIHKIIEDFINIGQNNIILVVPEQFSFETERMMIDRLGEKGAAGADVISFTRLAENILRDNGLHGGRHLDDAARTVLMSLALENVKSGLGLYSKHASKPQMITKMLALSDELKQAAIGGEMLEEVLNRAGEGILRQKLADIALITGAYDALVEREYADSRDDLSLLYDFLGESRYFEDKLIFIDAFRGFTAQEYKIIERMVVQAKAVYVTLCTDDLTDKGESDIFAHTKQTASRLKAMAKRCNVPFAKPQYLSGPSKYNNFPPKFTRYASEALAALEAGLYNPEAPVYEGECGEITLYAAPDIYAECRFIASSAKKLMREEGLRCRDMAVIARSADSYEAILKDEFRKVGIPVFEDKRQPLANQPLTVFVRSALEIAAKGFSADALMRYLKTGLAGLDIEQVSLLENYAFLWQLSPGEWLSEWVKNPEGAASELSEAGAELLKELNELREKAVLPLLKLRKKLSGESGGGMARALFELLEETAAAENLKALALSLKNEGETEIALEQDRVWETLMQITDSAEQTLAGRQISAERFAQLFDLMLLSQTLGTLPGGLDEITIGSADRIRISAPKAVFIAGANEGVFPPVPEFAGIFTQNDRERLALLGVELSENGESKVAEERFIAYSALCLATERLFVCYSQTDLSGAELAPSELVANIEWLFPNCMQVSAGTLASLWPVESYESAFEQAARMVRGGGEEYESLKKCLEGSGEYRDKILSLETNAGERQLKIENKSVANELFKGAMRLSASRAESYYECPFSFFCEYGLKAKTKRPAEIGRMQSGTIIHRILELLIKKHGSALGELSKAERLEEIRLIADEFVKENFGEISKTETIKHNHTRLINAVNAIAEKIIKELQNSSFVPVDFELELGNDIPPYELELENGSSIKLTGKIDRVDIAEINEKKFVRIIDYKSYKKDFLLSDVLDGTDLQLMIYLFAVLENGDKRYGEISPAGALYLPAIDSSHDLGRDAGEDEALNKKMEKTRMSGLLIKSTEVILAMDKSGRCAYIPAGLDKNGTPKGSVVEMKTLEALKQRVNGSLIKMAASLNEGKIEALPVSEKGGETPACERCGYSAVCLREKDMPARKRRETNFEETVSEIEEDLTRGDL